MTINCPQLCLFQLRGGYGCSWDPFNCFTRGCDSKTYINSGGIHDSLSSSHCFSSSCYSKASLVSPYILSVDFSCPEKERENDVPPGTDSIHYKLST